MISRAIANNGLPLKIQTEWTEDVYTNQDIDGNISTVEVNGWLIRINGKKYPRQLGDEGIDWTYRYTSPNTEEGRQTAIKRALSEARLTIW
tara:strand:+ start:882 stop:1154 length:273 start_codon:yes stop_codon:yes gene_type:complete